MPPPAEGGVADLVHQVGGGAVRDLADQGLGIGVVEDNAFGVLSEAGGLLIGGLVETLLVELDAQRTGG